MRHSRWCVLFLLLCLLVPSLASAALSTQAEQTLQAMIGPSGKIEVFTLQGRGAPAVSPVGQGRIYFDSTSNSFQASQNGGAYAALSVGSLTGCSTTGTVLIGGSPPTCSATPTLTTSLTIPLLIGGTTTTSTLTLRSTSGVGAAGADIIFQTGNNGATEAMRIDNSGLVTAKAGFTATGTGAVNITTTSNDINQTATGAGRNSLIHITGDQAYFQGWAPSGPSSDNGSIRFGINASYYGRLWFNNTGATVLSLDSAFDNITSVIQFRLRTLGTPVTAITILGSGNVGFLTTSPTNLVSLGGNAARTIWMERHTTSNTAGNTLTVQAGGATSGATDKAGGDSILAPGAATGTGKAKVQLQSAIAGATGTADRSPVTHIQVSQGHLVSLGTATTVSSCGSTPSIVGNDIAGKVTIGTGTITSCTVTFATPYDTNAPSCLTENTSAVLATTSSTTTTVLTITSATTMASAVINYVCIGME